MSSLGVRLARPENSLGASRWRNELVNPPTRRDNGCPLVEETMTQDMNTAPDATEPCARCGEETAAGSALFSARRRVELSGGEGRAYFCGSCDRELVASGGQRMTDDEVRRAVEGGSLATITIARER